MEIIKKANKVIKEGLALLPDDAKADFKAMAGDIFIDEAIGNALGAVNDDPEKIAILRAYSVQEANRVASTLWRLELLSPEFEKEYRGLPSLKEVADNYNEFEDANKAKEKEVSDQLKAIADRKKEMDIFKGIINGVPAKESEKRYNDFMKQQQAAMGR